MFFSAAQQRRCIEIRPYYKDGGIRRYPFFLHPISRADSLSDPLHNGDGSEEEKGCQVEWFLEPVWLLKGLVRALLTKERSVLMTNKNLLSQKFVDIFWARVSTAWADGNPEQEEEEEEEEEEEAPTMPTPYFPAWYCICKLCLCVSVWER